MEPNRDTFLLKTISSYCSDISAAVERFSIDEDKVQNDADMRAILAFFVQQIGETAGKLSIEFRNSHPQIEWNAIIGFRNHIAHAYGKVIPEILWDTVKNDIPELKNFCNTLAG